MRYIRLPYSQYFIDTSEDYNHTGRVGYAVKYIAANYVSGPFRRKHEVNYEIHYEPERDVIQIHFQCTNGFSDWVANIFEFSSRYYHAITFEGEPLQLRVHHGWGDMYLAIKRVIREEWMKLHSEHPDAHTEVVGWSLGSALACLCSQDLNFNFGVKTYLYTFGSVRPFKCLPTNKARTMRYLSTVCAKCMNFADLNDVITYLPPFRGFTMIRRVIVGADEKRTIFRLFRPLKYHTRYGDEKTYSGL